MHLDDLVPAAFMLAFAVGIPAWIVYRVWWSKRPIRRGRLDPVDEATPRKRRASPVQIDMEQHEYRADARPGEPLFRPGGVMFLVGFVVLTLVSLWLRDVLSPVVDWLLGPRPR